MSIYPQTSISLWFNIHPKQTNIGRRLKTISTIDIKERIPTIGYLFVADGIADPSITAIDSTLIKAKGSVWHKSFMKNGLVPRPGIDTDASGGAIVTQKDGFLYSINS